jgi:hypothetical protein
MGRSIIFSFVRTIIETPSNFEWLGAGLKDWIMENSLMTINYTNCLSKCAESHFAYYNGKCRYIFEVALGEKRTKGAFQIVIGITFHYGEKNFPET